MADIKKIKLGNDTYNIVDAGAAREGHDHDDRYVKIDSKSHALAAKVYGVKNDGTQQLWNVATTATPYTIPYRNAGGTLTAADPTEDTHLATKKYADGKTIIIHKIWTDAVTSSNFPEIGFKTFTGETIATYEEFVDYVTSWITPKPDISEMTPLDLYDTNFVLTFRKNYLIFKDSPAPDSQYQYTVCNLHDFITNVTPGTLLCVLTRDEGGVTRVVGSRSQPDVELSDYKLYNIEHNIFDRVHNDLQIFGDLAVTGASSVESHLTVGGKITTTGGLHVQSGNKSVVDIDVPTEINENLTVTGETHLRDTHIAGPVVISSGEMRANDFQLKDYWEVSIEGNKINLIGNSVTAPSIADLDEGTLGKYQVEDDIVTDSQDIINKEVLYDYNSKVNAKIRTLEEQTFSMYGSKNQADIQRVEETEEIENPVKGQIACFFATTNSLSQGGTGAPGDYPVVKQTYKRYDGNTWVDISTTTIPYIKIIDELISVGDIFDQISIARFEDIDDKTYSVKECILDYSRKTVTHEYDFTGLCKIYFDESYNTYSVYLADLLNHTEYAPVTGLTSGVRFTMVLTQGELGNRVFSTSYNAIKLIDNKCALHFPNTTSTAEYQWHLPEKSGSIALTSDLPYTPVNHESLENNSINNILSYIYSNHTASFVQNSKVSFLVNGHTLYNFNNIFSNTWTINEIYLLTGANYEILVQSENGALTELVNLDQLDSLNLVGYDTVVKTHYATGLAYDLKGFGNDSYYGIDYTNNYPVISTEDRSIGITTSAKDPSLGGNEQEVSWFYFPEVDEGVVATEQYVQDYVKNNGSKIEIVDLTA